MRSDRYSGISKAWVHNLRGMGKRTNTQDLSLSLLSSRPETHESGPSRRDERLHVLFFMRVTRRCIVADNRQFYSPRTVMRLEALNVQACEWSKKKNTHTHHDDAKGTHTHQVRKCFVFWFCFSNVLYVTWTHTQRVVQQKHAVVRNRSQYDNSVCVAYQAGATA